MSSRKPTADAELEKLQHDSFSYFLHETNPVNGLVIDKTAEDWPANIAATGLGWMYRLIVESILGLRLEADTLHVKPCIPEHWASFKMSYRYRETVYDITVRQTRETDGATRLTVDDIERHDLVIPLVDDRQRHAVDLRIHNAES